MPGVRENRETTRRVEPPTCCASVAPRPFCWSEMRGESAMDSPASGLLVRGVAAVLSWPERSSSWPRKSGQRLLCRDGVEEGARGAALGGVTAARAVAQVSTNA